MPLPMDTVEDALDHLDILAAVNPENYDAEKQRFFDALEDGETYNPQYTYPSFDLDAASAVIQDLEEQAETELDRRLVEQLQDLRRMIRVVGSGDITIASRSVYGSPSAALVKQARKRYNAAGPYREDRPVSADTIRQAYETLFNQLGMDYGVETTDTDLIWHDSLKRAVFFPHDGAYGPVQAKRILVHESTHAVRAYNGIQQNDPALVYGTKGYQVAEEGLPTFNEDDVGVFKDSLPRVTSRVIAVAEADKSFYELYQSMRELGLTQRLAFIRTHRIKRGLCDTSQSGGFIKDHIYFEGYSRIKESPGLADDLYVGKISFEDVGLLDKQDQQESDHGQRQQQKQQPAVTRDDHLAAYRDAVSVLEDSA